MLTKSTLLLHYKRNDIQSEIINNSKDLEIGTKYDFGYGKRPEILTYRSEILDFAKKGCTSFHMSEERWSNPLQLGPNLKKKDLENLRIGWDLVLDIDCPYWEFSKLSSKLIIKALNDHGIKRSVSIKFSGNKGFHIGVPFESFPKTINNKETRTLFPEAARIIALYLFNYIKDKYPFKNNIVDFDRKTYSIDKIKEITNKSFKELTENTCEKCKKVKVEQNYKYMFICENCESKYDTDKTTDYIECQKCKKIIKNKQMISLRSKNLKYCDCKDTNTITKFNFLNLIDIDTILISSRHLYRGVYSFHEKSGLVSAPFNPEKIDKFKKKFCHPDNLKISKYRFLDRKNAIPNEAEKLFIKAYAEHDKNQSKIVQKEQNIYQTSTQPEFEEIEDEIPKEFFPPCMTLGLKGLEDGKKRFLFSLINFLSMTGYNYERIYEIIKEWNNNNLENLRETNLLGQFNYAKQNKKKILPPNCDNDAYYKELGICQPDNICQKIKNPVNYAKRKQKFGKKPIKKKEKADSTN